MLKLVLALLALFGYVPKGPSDAFNMFEQGYYKEATQLLAASNYYDVLKALNSKEQTLLTSCVINGAPLREHYSLAHAVDLQEQALSTIIAKTAYDVFFINQRDVHWQTPLMHAALLDDESSATMLYMYGADPRIKDIYGKSAREYAHGPLRERMKSWEWQTLEMLRDPYNVWRLLRAGAHSSLIVQTLTRLNGYALFQLRDSIGNSVLHAAIIYAYKTHSQTLDHELQQKEALAVLDYAYNNCSDAFKDEFIDVQNSQGQTALMWAAKCGYQIMSDWLLERHANTQLTDVVGRTAANYAHPATHKALLDLLEQSTLYYSD